ncbi:hypothetical protein [Candidatus Albibeggiatoa sp. nov. NOAA]|uniref:hypothetical protein n=1 Tax=Candidatus Albibeggiatoa sp. nov. NOAA TaxID=3162724 RepID=UPI003300F4F5|nr:hypothetical protein [Thiotrichaceae bacterium]
MDGYFLDYCKKALQSYLFKQEIQNIQQTLDVMSRDELNHLKAEFENYQALYPHG